MTDTSELLDRLYALAARIADLETQVETLKKSQRVPEEDLILISAAVAAFLGHKATVRAVRFSQSSSWTRELRGRIHDRSVLHVR